MNLNPLFKRILTALLVVLLGFVLGCRFFTPVADFYASHCYPILSACLSLMSSVVPFSLEEIVVLGFVFWLVFVLIRAVRQKKGFRWWLRRTAVALLWLYVWFYMGWMNNYFRTPLYARLDIQPASYDEAAFSRFLADYTVLLNGTAGAAPVWDRSRTETEIKVFYASQIRAAGYVPLHPWQHVKKPLLNPLYSAVGVLGFMGPCFSEAQLNRDLLPNEHPFTMAHELAHLSGVTSEAEANYWAYAFCRQAADPAVRYSGCLSLLPYVASSVRTFFSEEDYGQWVATLSEQVKEDDAAEAAYWAAKRVPIIDTFQHWLMDLSLRTNRVAEGARDYYGVIGIIMSMDAARREL